MKTHTDKMGRAQNRIYLELVSFDLLMLYITWTMSFGPYQSFRHKPKEKGAELYQEKYKKCVSTVKKWQRNLEIQNTYTN